MAVRYALDASALLCLLNQEEGQERVRVALAEAVISAVNYSEVVAKLVERGGAAAAISRALEHLHLTVVDFDRTQGVEGGALRQATRQAGLSFGDRACLALAKSKGLTALTADQAWEKLEEAVGVTVELVR
ncbi:type II toxin-antitoxin system VapC family toxin [Methylobacterium indicum]|uniref:Twitching motility protein PilT n=1 Tax=Methylobacterium indicum TaxID=1775910 RepID=A0ABR5HIN4_9HYPH|nr:type II toxin-antitoxin system VapC family toxin [Methylobacterium indicum]KMO22829.1 twitching motility protein PilT [Methylobacterium indicum]KMO26507.1 twitching motility protein PilT [Methylobacterium indicum]